MKKILFLWFKKFIVMIHDTIVKSILTTIIVCIVSVSFSQMSFQREYIYDASGNRICRRVLELPANILRNTSQPVEEVPSVYFQEQVCSYSCKIYPNPVYSILKRIVCIIFCNDSEYLEDKGYNSLAIEMFSLYGTGDNTKVTRKYGNSCSIDLFETIMNKEYYTQEWLPFQTQTKKMWKIMTDIMKMPKDYCRTEEPKFMIEIVCDGNYFYLPVSGCWGLGEDTEHNERWHDKHQNKYLKQMKQMLTFIRSKCKGN